MNGDAELLRQWIERACIWEVSARKAGNIHPQERFEDSTYHDFVASAVAIAPIIAGAAQKGVGHTILQAVQATRAVVTGNVNLGIVLLLTPLAAVPISHDLRRGVIPVLDALTIEDSALVFDAIRLVAPGGLGRAPHEDVNSPPSRPLREIMALAADRDLIARQYMNGFQDVFQEVATLLQALADLNDMEQAIVFTHLHLLSRVPDSHIARKRGLSEALEASRHAGDVLRLDWPHTVASRAAFSEFDHWLRAVGNARNPGTSADIIAACLFVALREDILSLTQMWHTSIE